MGNIKFKGKMQRVAATDLFLPASFLSFGRNKKHKVLAHDTD